MARAFVLGRRYEEVPAGDAEAFAATPVRVVRQNRRGFPGQVKKSKIFCHVLDHDIVGDQVTIESRGERCLQLRVGIDQEIVFSCADKNECVHFSFRAQDTGRHREIGVRLAHVVGHLPVEETHPVASGQAQLDASGEIEERH